MKKFEDLVGTEQNFYGISGETFKLGRYVFQAVEDENDGYRSSMDRIVLIEEKGKTFNEKPVAKVKVVEVKDRPIKRTYGVGPVNVDSGYELVDVEDGHVWLSMGTDNEDDYYPSFVFSFNPKVKD